YDSMFVAWKQTLNFNPAHEEALDRIWLCVEMSRKFNESIELCNQLIDHDPYCDKAWYNLGHAHTYFGDYNEAIEAYEYAFIINNKFEWAYRHCAELCMEIQNYKKALDCYEEVLVHIPPDGELLFKIGQCYHFLGKISIAQKFYYQSIQLDDLNDEVYYYLGRCSVLQQNWEEATRLYRKAIEIEGKREEYFAALGQAYAKLNRNSRLAIRCFEKAIELAPEQSEYWVRLAAYLLESNNPQACLDVLMEADEHAVGAELLYCRAACLFKMEEKRTATNFLADALTEDYEGHEILFIFAPELKKVRKIRAIIDFYKYER
ncbi:MAG: tetratricopeptide repeat protein, partial [Bacteroidota bacterium]